MIPLQKLLKFYRNAGFLVTFHQSFIKLHKKSQEAAVITQRFTHPTYTLHWYSAPEHSLTNGLVEQQDFTFLNMLSVSHSWHQLEGMKLSETTTLLNVLLMANRCIRLWEIMKKDAPWIRGSDLRRNSLEITITIGLRQRNIYITTGTIQNR